MNDEAIGVWLITKYGSLDHALEVWKESHVVSVEMQGFTSAESKLLLSLLEQKHKEKQWASEQKKDQPTRKLANI